MEFSNKPILPGSIVVVKAVSQERYEKWLKEASEEFAGLSSKRRSIIAYNKSD